MSFRLQAQLFVCALVIANVSLAQAPPPAGFPGKAPAGPPAEIVRFEAAPAAIDPGDSVTLRWEALNAFSLAFPMKILLSVLLIGLVLYQVPGVLDRMIDRAGSTMVTVSGG